MLSTMPSTEKPWWRTAMGSPEWMTTDRPWHGWAFASGALLFCALLLLIAPKYVVVGPMSASGVMALFQAIRVRNGGHE